MTEVRSRQVGVSAPDADPKQVFLPHKARVTSVVCPTAVRPGFYLPKGRQTDGTTCRVP